ncbi:MAG: ATP synthase subunit I [Pseudomonadota bacterium]
MPQRVLLAQAATGLVVAMAVSIWGLEQGIAALVGLACVLAPNALLARQLQRGGDAHRLLLQGLVKFAATVLLLVIALKWLRPEAPGFFAGFGAAVLAQVFAPLGIRSPTLATVPQIDSDDEQRGGDAAVRRAHDNSTVDA